MLGTVPEGVVWGIFLLPVGALLTILFLPRGQAKLAGYVSILAVALSFVLSLWVLDSVIQSHGETLGFRSHEWLQFGAVQINIGLNVDGLAAIMLIVVTSVSLMVQVYSQGYMEGDPGYWRFYSYLSLFTTSMLGVVLADNLVMVYAFWEMVGLCSYLLIGFWFHRPAAAAAAKKAFLTTRLGDLGFLLAILLIFHKANTFDIHTIQGMAVAGSLSGTTLTFFALGIFAGAAGKSAQVPFHVWLPDAMEGPTPVSALIHAATMVAAGVYLVARMFPVFHASPDAMHVVGAIGGVTAISAAMLGLVMTDIKRVLAYSTISQLGYMMLALGVGGYVAAIFHLFTHAYFKALLFLGSGSVNHSTNTFDMRLMGGLRKAMPITFATFVIASLSLAGIFPFSGFWSKDEILSDAWTHEKYLFVLAFLTVGLTAFYMFRAIFMTFGGEYRGGAEPEEGHGGHAGHPHESPLTMAVPLLVLAVPAALVGFANIDKGFEDLLKGALPLDMQHDFESSKFHLWIAAAGMAMALGGIALAYVIYSAKALSAARLQQAFAPVHNVLANKYYADVLYERIIVGFLFYEVLGGALAWFDRVIVDGAVNGAGWVARQTAGAVRYIQDGEYQTYGAIGFAGLVFAVIVVLALNPP